MCRMCVGFFLFIFFCFSGVDAAGPVMDLGEDFNKLTNEVVTPHVAWARPLPSGPIRTLFIVPRLAAREAVELTQRVDMDYDSVLCYMTDTLGHYTGYMEIVGANEEGVIESLRSKLEYPWDIIIIGHVNFDIIPEFARKKLFKLVEEGTPLLYVFPDEGIEARSIERDGKIIWRDKVPSVRKGIGDNPTPIDFENPDKPEDDDAVGNTTPGFSFLLLISGIIILFLYYGRKRKY